ANGVKTEENDSNSKRGYIYLSWVLKRVEASRFLIMCERILGVLWRSFASQYDSYIKLFDCGRTPFGLH
ncbi:MAG: hypothetical protein ACI9F2_000700, partial [Lysobacterales bacterium]